jgi:hypothetical protein
MQLQDGAKSKAKSEESSFAYQPGQMNYSSADWSRQTASWGIRAFASDPRSGAPVDRPGETLSIRSTKTAFYTND